MAALEHIGGDAHRTQTLSELCSGLWDGKVTATFDGRQTTRLHCGPDHLVPVAQWLSRDLDFAFATLIVEESTVAGWSLVYVFYDDSGPSWTFVEVELEAGVTTVPSISGLVHGPSADWHEREAEDLFGLTFEGHPRLGEFILHEDWPEGVNPMRRDFDAHQQLELRAPDPRWEPPTIVTAPGAFAMPVGPVFSDFAESAHFLLETVGEDVIRTIPRFFYKYRGVEKIAEGQKADRVLLLAERFSGTSAFAHGLALCQAIEAICGVDVPPRAQALRTVFAELERLRHHMAAITGICHSTALAVATSQAALIEENLLRLSCEISGHRYLFGLIKPGGLTRDLPEDACEHLATVLVGIAERLRKLHQMLRYSGSFLDRLEEVGIISTERAVAYGLVGPIARASGLARDIRKLFPYAAYGTVKFEIPVEEEGDGYARLRIFFREAEQSAAIIRDLLLSPPPGSICADRVQWQAGGSLVGVEAPDGAAFHWLRLAEDGTVRRYHITPPSFTNWHGFHLAAENFAFQDFPIILASFGLSNAECDR
ncbi:MAG TPA: NADH-quinone oxidoreductase subunit C [Xanthobacteraceae bacterium]|jgi:Ni,Fe-hydrogenase III large subunit/Ni,Fe-hydrogenase III component G